MGNKLLFSGPIFIVGIPRSGTKLLRDLLNQHSLIAIPPHESGFIPYYYRGIYNFGKDFKKFRNFQAFYNDISRTRFFRRMSVRGKGISVHRWFSMISNWSFSGIMEGLFVAYAESEGKNIWGDKTPTYLVHLPLLSRLFPAARFIHIVRDPRDTCLSINKAWGKNIYRAAQRWNDDIKSCRKFAHTQLEGSYREIKYESLTDSPEKVLPDICHFLDIEFEKRMLQLNGPSEKVGDARGAPHIVKNNYGKWERGLTYSQVRKIEEICHPLMADLGYSPSYQGRVRRLSEMENALYKASDVISVFRRRFSKNESLLAGLKHVIRSRKMSANRNRSISEKLDI